MNEEVQTDYTLGMSRTILLAGKEMSLAKDFAETAAKSRNVIVASTLEGPENKKKISEAVKVPLYAYIMYVPSLIGKTIRKVSGKNR